jgi:hypothetical protein
MKTSPVNLPNAPLALASTRFNEKEIRKRQAQAEEEIEENPESENLRGEDTAARGRGRRGLGKKLDITV